MFIRKVLYKLQTKINSETGEPLDELETETMKWVSSLGSTATTVSEILQSKDAAVCIMKYKYIK